MSKQAWQNKVTSVWQSFSGQSYCVSIFDLGTGSSLLMDLSLLKGFQVANSSTSVLWVPRTLFCYAPEVSLGSRAAHFACSSLRAQFDPVRSSTDVICWKTLKKKQNKTNKTYHDLVSVLDPSAATWFQCSDPVSLAVTWFWFFHSDLWSIWSL